MSVKLERDPQGGILKVRATGTLTREDYGLFVPMVEQMIADHGKVRILFDMHDFSGWKPGALWEDIKFDVKHFKDIERLALVGDKKWQEWMASFCRPFTTAEIRYFDAGEQLEAEKWLHGEPAAETSGG